MLERPLGWLERLIYQLIGPAARTEQDWKAYGKTTVVFSFVFWIVLYGILRTQTSTPSTRRDSTRPRGTSPSTPPRRSSRNTNWQYYGGETTMSYFSQMAGLAVQNFVSAAVGMAVLAAVIRGFASRGSRELGNFWRDVTRTLLYILLPLAAVGTLILVSQGVIQSLGGYVTVHGTRRPRPDPRDGPRRLPDRDQAARDQRRRLLQRQQHHAVREPDAVLELRRGDLHPADPGRGHGAIRPDGRESPPGLGSLRDDARLHGRALRRGLRRRAAWVSRAACRR